MCGLCGKLHFDRHRPIDRGVVQNMMNRIQHRGPDGSGEFFSGPVGLAHRRLSIIDLDTGGQPMSNEDGTVWVVYNGEIYNFAELRTELIGRGHHFKSYSDTEVIVHMYEEMGDQCVTRFRGMFAFALWDDRREHLLLARDHVGVKPLYFVNTGTALTFASEIKALVADPEVGRRVNLRAIDRFLTYYYLPGSETLLDGVFKLSPGHYLTVDDGQVSEKQYWDLRFQTSPRTPCFHDSVEALRILLSATVKHHMISDVPLGMLLSGGVDSTGVLSYAVQHTEKPIHTFTMGFGGTDFADERPYARLAAKTFGTHHHEVSMNADDFLGFLPKYVWHMEEPVCEPPAVALYFLSDYARQSGVKVLLSGEGGDEAFGGYQEYRNLLLLERLKTAFRPAPGLLRRGFNLLSRAGWRRGAYYSALSTPPLCEYYFSRTASPYTAFNRLKPSLYNKEFAAALGDSVSDAPTRALFGQMAHQPTLNRMLYIDTKTWLPDDLLVKADKITMAASVELRVPLLDYRILEFAATLPAHYKVDGWNLKRILKVALSHSVPRKILNRRKTGFPVPYDLWLRSTLKDFVFDTILSRNNACSAYFSREAVTKLLNANQLKQGFAKEVFCLLIFELWHQKFISIKPPSDLQTAIAEPQVVNA